MYGKRNNYFNSQNKGFHNSVWIELIGFEKNAEDFGIENYIKNLGFTPDSLSLHLTSIDFANLHKGMEEEYILPKYVCSYSGHPENDERKRQDWTNYDLKRFIGVLKKRNIKVFASFFDLLPEDEFSSKHPEILSNTVCDGIRVPIMIKRFSDGSYYEDFLLKKLIALISDYGFDGVQLADGISSPRNAIWFADFSSDLIEQSGINIPDNIKDVPLYISTNLRAEWIAFYRKRWGDFLTKIIRGLKSVGALVAVNSAWTRDPLEAIYRYGTDYKIIEQAGADYFIVEDVSSDLAILAYEDNHSYAFSYEERKMIHYEFVANLMAVRANNKKMKVTPLFMIWDNQEQWDVIHHAPTAMQRAAAADFTHFYLGEEGWCPITDGPHFCLGDALKSSDWDFIRLQIDNGYTKNVSSAEGAIFIWSEDRMENELESLIKYGTFHSAKWLAVLLRAGAQITRTAHISMLDRLTGDILVTNYSLLTQKEKAKIDAYKNGRVIIAEWQASTDVSHKINPPKNGWPRPLDFSPVPQEYIKNLAEKINQNANASLLSGKEECTLHEVKTGENTAKILVENNEYYYVIPKIETKRKIRKLKIITKPDGYFPSLTDNTFRVRIAGRGVDIAEIEYE